MHKKTHQQENSAVFVCETCQQSFHSKMGLKKHEAKDHGVDRRKPGQSRPCPTCHTIFKNKAALSAHLRRKHKPSVDVKVSNNDNGNNTSDEKGECNDPPVETDVAKEKEEPDASL